VHGGSCVVLRRGDQVFCGVGAVTRRQYIILYIFICNLRQMQRNNFEISN
jgi:hypothetical protein